MSIQTCISVSPEVTQFLLERKQKFTMRTCRRPKLGLQSFFKAFTQISPLEAMLG